MPSRKSILTMAAFVGATALAGCGPEYDPLTRAGLWTPEHVNRADLVLMAANPADLVRGTGETGANGVLAAAAINRLQTDKLKKLLSSGTSDITARGQGE